MKLTNEQLRTVSQVEKGLRSWKVWRYVYVAVPLLALGIAFKAIDQGIHSSSDTGMILVGAMLSSSVLFAAVLMVTWEQKERRLLIELVEKYASSSQ
ncbi:MAG: hypothetical protein AAGF72_01490 [Pseudomonadota bacterium]